MFACQCQTQGRDILPPQPNQEANSQLCQIQSNRICLIILIGSTNLCLKSPHGLIKILEKSLKLLTLSGDLKLPMLIGLVSDSPGWLGGGRGWS